MCSKIWLQRRRLAAGRNTLDSARLRLNLQHMQDTRRSGRLDTSQRKVLDQKVHLYSKWGQVCFVALLTRCPIALKQVEYKFGVYVVQVNAATAMPLLS